MNSRINDKADEIEGYLAELEEIKPLTFKDYSNDLKTKAACERYIEKIVEAVVDIAFLVIKEKALGAPENDAEALMMLAENEIISSELAGKLQDAKGMRNILAHEYGEIDDEIIFNSINEELGRDVKEFIKKIKESG